jgi:hypothetical protein
MATCQRFDAEFLAGWEATGELPGEHLRTCLDCMARQRSYQRLAAALRAADAPPLASDWQERVFDRVRALQPVSSVSDDSAARSELLVRSKPRKERWLARAAAFVAAAAAVMFCLHREQVEPSLPDYMVSIDGGQRVERSSTSAQTFKPRMPFQLWLRPGHAVQARLAARAFVNGDRRQELLLKIATLPKGVMRIDAIVPEPRLALDHTVNIVIVIGSSRTLSADETLPLDVTKHAANVRHVTTVLELTH